MAELRTDFKDDILTEAMEGRRRYQMIQNEDGTVSFVDVTEYEQVGSDFGQGEINKTNMEVNNKFDSDDVVDPMTTTEAGFAADAKLTGDALQALNVKMVNISTFEQRLIAVEKTQANYASGPQTGTVPFGLMRAGTSQQATVVFPKLFTKTPTITISLSTDNDATKYLTYTVSGKTASSFVLTVKNIDDAAGAWGVVATWRASA